MPKETKPDEELAKPFNIYLSNRLMAALDEFCKQTTGRPLQRSTAMRQLIEEGLSKRGLWKH